MRFQGRHVSVNFVLQAILGTVVACTLSLQGAPVSAQGEQSGAGVAYEENGALGNELKLPVYHWWQPDSKSRGLVVAVHGLVMHGKSYDTMGRTLAAQGFDVYAIDLRGHGRSTDSDHKFCTSIDDCKHRIDYNRSFEDLSHLARCVREQHPKTPLFAVGESLGGGMVIRLAAKNPELVDGLILSAPAIKHHSFLDPYVMANGALLVAKPRTQVDLMPFVRRFASDDPRVIAEKEVDPLLRRHLSAFELMQSSNSVRKTITFVEEIPPAMPVLVIQGSADRCIKADAVMLLLSHLRSADQTVKWFHERGHILLETDFVKSDTMDAVSTWLNMHVEAPGLQARRLTAPTIASEALNISIENMHLSPGALGATRIK